MLDKQFTLEGKIQNFSKKAKIWMFQSQFYLECQGQDHRIPKPSETFRCFINSSSWKVKFQTIQFLTVKTKI